MGTSFHHVLSNLLAERNMRQSDLAVLCNVSPQMVSYWVSGKCEPKFDKLRRIAEIFKVPTDYLLQMDIAKHWWEAQRFMVDIDALQDTLNEIKAKYTPD